MTSASGTPDGTRGTKWLRVRLYISALALTMVFGSLAYKAWTIQVRDGARMRSLGNEQYLQELVIPAPRGPIKDANGVELAVSVNVQSAAVYSREITDVAASAGKLADALDLDVREVEARLSSGKHFEWLKRHLTPDEAKRVRELGLGGVRLIEEQQRFYPARDLLGPALGFADIDGRGIEGIELALDEKLKGERSTMNVIRDRRGQMVMATDLDPRSLGESAEPPKDRAGATVNLTIDRFIQFTAERALAEGIRENKAKAGVAVVMDPRTGAVLAMASYPTYDPNDAGARDVLARDRAVVDAYEAGSVMKVFSIAAALDAGVIKPNDTVDVEGGRLQVGRGTITDTHPHNVISIGEVVKYSSNVGAIKIARKLGREGLHHGLAEFGFGKRTGIELPGESRGLLRDASHFGETELATISFGYGFRASPIQIAAALVAVANGGTYYQPSIVSSVVGEGGKVLYAHAEQARHVLSAETSRAMTEMMKTVVQKGGTAAKLFVPGFVIAGKTGTAYKHDPVTHRYTLDHYMASFMGFAPADNPRLAILVMVDDPRGDVHYGGDVAAPIFGVIMGESLKYLGVAGDPDAPTAAAEPTPGAHAEKIEPKKKHEAIELPVAEPEMAMELPDVDDAEVPPAGPNEAIVLIPDFTGLSVGQALAAARASGVKLEIEGSGRAARQFPPPGRAMKSITCHVTFNPG